MNGKALRFGVGLLSCLWMVGCRFNTENETSSSGGTGSTSVAASNATGTSGSNGSQCIGAVCTVSTDCCAGFYCSAAAVNHCLPNGQITSTATGSSSSTVTSTSTGSNGSHSSSTGSGSTGGGSTGSAGSTFGGTSGNANDLLGGVRVAVLVPDLAQPLDFCLHSHSSPTTGYEIGPVAGNFGLSAGLSYQSVTRYLTLAADVYDIRTVAANSPDCSTPLVDFPDLVPGVTTQGHVYQTLVVMGLTAGTPAISLYGTTDTIVPTVPSAAAYRMLNAEVGVAQVDLALSTAAAVFGPVAYQHFGFDAVTGSSYEEDSGGTGLTYLVKDHASGTTVLTANNITLTPNTSTTMYLVGHQGVAASPLKLLVCKDEAIAPTIGDVLSSCTLH